MRSLEPLVSHQDVANLRDIIDGKVKVGDIRSLAVDDLSPRSVGLIQPPSANSWRPRVLSPRRRLDGSELCRQIVSLAPASLVMIDRTRTAST